MLFQQILATDIGDKQMREFRTERFAKAYDEYKQHANDMSDLKATVGMEYFIQACDVAHTMQAWPIYRQWNGKLFAEMYKAHREGRGGDPTSFWYKGEIGFFDGYVIPLAKQLKACEIFGSLADECLNFAQSNREQWVKHGHEAVQELMREHILKDDSACLDYLDKVIAEHDDYFQDGNKN
jgi:hypothetical protein